MTEDFEGGAWGEGVPTGSGDAVDYGGPAATQFAAQPGHLPVDQPPGGVGHQVPPVGAAPYQPFQGQPYLQPQFSPYQRPDGTQQALLVSLISLILGFFCTVGFLGSPFGMILGRKEIAAIDAGLTDPINRSTAVIAFVCGIIGTVILALIVLGLVAILGFALFVEGTN